MFRCVSVLAFFIFKGAIIVEIAAINRPISS